MSRFSIRNPYLIFVLCVALLVVGLAAVLRMPVDLFPPIRIPVVVVATFFSGMPPEQIETDITGRFERFFSLASGIEHIESRSLPGVSLIKIYFQPGVDADAAVSNISNLSMANLRRLPPGTLPPVVLKFDASSLPVCLITLKGEGLTETQLRDAAQYAVRNQVANVPGASVPQPFGGRYRQVMVYVDPMKLEAHQLSPMDVVRGINDNNVILPAGDTRIGPLDYSLYTNAMVEKVEHINKIPLKVLGGGLVTVGDIGEAKDAQQIQNNMVRVDGQPSVYLPVLKQGGDTNTISVVDGIRTAISGLVDVPEQLTANVVFDQSAYVRNAIETLVHEGALGLVMTAVMILVFLGSFSATIAVCLSIPLSALATFLAISIGGGTLDTMILGGLALVFSRVIDNSVVVLENIFRHMEFGELPATAAEKGGAEVALPVLAATLTTAVVFFPVTMLYGVSKFLFSALALAVVLALAASYIVALTVVPLFCARFIRVAHHGKHDRPGWMDRFNYAFNAGFERVLDLYSHLVGGALRRPWAVCGASLAIFAGSLLLVPKLGVAFFPRTDAGQFVINVKAPSGTRLENTSGEIAKVEGLIRSEVAPNDLAMIVSNIGTTPGFSSIYTSNSAQHTAFVQVSLKEGHKGGSYDYMARVRRRLASDMPHLTTYFQSGGLVDAVLNLGLPAPIDVQVSGSDLETSYEIASRLAASIRQIEGVSDVYIPQDLDYPAIKLDIDRTRAGQMGLTQREVVSNVITALTSNQMIAPSFWIDEKSGNDYMLTVQYPENQIRSMEDLRAIPLHSPKSSQPTRLDSITEIKRINAPTEVDHYQLRRVIDVFVGLQTEDLGRVATRIDQTVASLSLPKGTRVTMRGMVQGMRESFRSFGIGLCLAVLLLYLILVAQFRSFVDPFIILLAVPMGLTGVVIALFLWNTTLNVQSLMGVVMMVGIVVSNSILIVEFTHRLIGEGMAVQAAVAEACRVRLRPVLMTSLATLIGLLPMAMKLGTGSESYAPLAQAIIGGLSVSLLFTIFLVPAAFSLVYGRRPQEVQQ
ncbi:MAG: efflux RND transporter permease subunit [Bryobacteraceae bacterium]|nr:efflux RND transporter permease subunit [Bryobacteraceae bacterium]